MKETIRLLADYFQKHPPSLGDEESILDSLFWLYTENNNPDSKAIIEQFKKLRKYLNLPPEEYDEVFYIVTSLCIEHGKQTFRSGFGLALALVEEVKSE